MGKTFEDLHGRVHSLDNDELDISVDTNEDIATDKISGYFVRIEDSRFEVNEKTYDAVKNYLGL